MNKLIPAWVNGKLKPVNKLDAHRNALKHKAISVFLINGNETLIQKRAMSKYHTPGLWANTCCSHPNWNENPENCARRRLKEELGIVSKIKLQSRNQIEYKANVGNGLVEHELVDIFIQVLPSKESINIQINPQEVMDTRWITFQKLQEEIKLSPKQFTPWIKIYLENHLEQIFAI